MVHQGLVGVRGGDVDEGVVTCEVGGLEEDLEVRIQLGIRRRSSNEEEGDIPRGSSCCL